MGKEGFLSKILPRLNSIFQIRRPPHAPTSPPPHTPLKLPCRADLWCRKRTSISTMLDPELFDRYKTGDDRIDEEWIVQSNPPCAFKVEFKDGCDALLELLAIDPGLHATKGWLNLTPSGPELDPSTREITLVRMAVIVRTAERELLRMVPEFNANGTGV